jgi:hypothetical protein
VVARGVDGVAVANVASLVSQTDDKSLAQNFVQRRYR